MSDLIDREDAVNAIYHHFPSMSKRDAEMVLYEVPTAEPQERKGKWIHREDMDFLDENKVEHIHFMCSECGLIHDFLDWHTAQYNYCPNCGARMEVDNEQVSI